MCGSRNGTSTQIVCAEESRAIFVHCYGHALNLAAGDTIKGNKVLRSALDTTLEISKLIKFSPRREATFQNLKEKLVLRVLVFELCVPLDGLSELLH